MKNIYFLWATIRPEMMYETYKHWMNTKITNANVALKVAVLTNEQKIVIDNYNIMNCDVVVIDDEIGYAHAITKLTSQLQVNDNDILLLISDDFYSPKGWDEYLLNKFNNWNGALFIDDGYQNPKIKDNDDYLALTLACMTFECLKKLNRVALHPDYHHFFSDNEIFQNLKALNLLKDDRDIDNMVFEHRCSALNKRDKDENDERYHQYREEDKATFYRRLKLSVEDRLKL